MTKVIAALEAGASARPVLEAAGRLSEMLSAEVEAVHVLEDGETARLIAGWAGVRLTLARGEVAEHLIRRSRARDVAAVVLGIRSRPWSRRPVGHNAMAAASGIDKPVLLVPPNVSLPINLNRALVPMEAEADTADSLRETINLLCARGLDVVFLHVHQEHELPAFADHAHHEAESWNAEFMKRYSPRPRELRVESRIGPIGRQVLTVAGQVDANLIVLAWTRSPGEGRAQVVDHVLTHSCVCVLLLPLRRSERDGVRHREAGGASP